MSRMEYHRPLRLQRASKILADCGESKLISIFQNKNIIFSRNSSSRGCFAITSFRIIRLCHPEGVKRPKDLGRKCNAFLLPEMHSPGECFAIVTAQHDIVLPSMFIEDFRKNFCSQSRFAPQEGQMHCPFMPRLSAAAAAQSKQTGFPQASQPFCMCRMVSPKPASAPKVKPPCSAVKGFLQ
jgi:hypothetical protein